MQTKCRRYWNSLLIVGNSFSQKVNSSRPQKEAFKSGKGQTEDFYQFISHFKYLITAGMTWNWIWFLLISLTNSVVVKSSGRNIVLKQWICTPFASFWVKSSFSLFEFPTDNWVFLGFQFETSFSYPDDPLQPDTKLQAICITISM